MENHFNCIYCYTNKVNGKKYVGQAVDFLKRHKSHFNNAHNPKSSEYDTPFHRSIRKRTNHNFKKYEETYTIEILKENLILEQLGDWEKYYIAELDLLAKNLKGYNVALGGNGGNLMIGKTDEEKAEISKKHSESVLGEKNHFFGKCHTEETKRKISEERKGKNIGEDNYMYGKHHTEEYKKQLSEKAKKRFENKENHPNYGKHLSEETKRKLSEAQKGKKYSDETNLKKGRKGSKNHKARKVIQLNSSTMQVIKIWEYAKEPCEKFNFNYETFRNYVKGNRKTHEYSGFLWYYLDEYEQLTK